MTLQPVIIIAGPTASGKSSLAISLAEARNGAVINADSMQVYQELRILTARPGKAEMECVPHKLFGTLSAARRCDAMQWRDMALREIRLCEDRGQIPILVGGSGLYLQALLHGLDPIPGISEEIRGAVRHRLRAEGAEMLHSELSARDPESAGRIRPGDGQRIVRALEVLEQTGRGLAHWHDEGLSGPPVGIDFFTTLVMPRREELYAACDSRFLVMLEEGAIGEVEGFLQAAPAAENPLRKAVGLSAIERFLVGDLSEAEMIDQAQRDTRRYAKRQVTWFRNRFAPDHVCSSHPAERYREQLLARIDEFF